MIVNVISAKLLSIMTNLLAVLGSAVVAVTSLFAGAQIPEAVVAGAGVGTLVLGIVWRSIRTVTVAARRADELNQLTINRLEEEVEMLRQQNSRLRKNDVDD